jgi:hypothetical protein
MRNLDKWEKFFDEEQIFIGFYDQIKENPSDLLNNIILFLNLESYNNSFERFLHKSINSREYPKIPTHFENYLTNKYFHEIKKIHKKFDNKYTAGWLENAIKTLSNHN